PIPEPGKEYSYSLAAVQAILGVGRMLVVSEGRVNTFYLSIMKEFKDLGMPEEVITNSVNYGQAIAKSVLEWAALDNYQQTRSMPRYALSSEESTWKPTPPSYLKAVEPNWSKMRTFLMDSAQQFKPLPANKFSTDKNSKFYLEAQAVFQAGKDLTEDQNEIANFWDCNPFKVNLNGHVMYASKKISPGGHWVNITRLACRQSSASLVKSLEAYACVAITLADAFISCWDEKYRSNVIRPETYINKYIDGSWQPLLQTPPFPEYTSGHSVLSTAAAVMLEKFFGENFVYSDSTEVEFGVPVRNFKSLKAAAAEAAISRFYGGIHYMSSITNGADEGRLIGLYVAGKLKTRTFFPAGTISSGKKVASKNHR
ncbi:MAG: vanadium-dependent haloperoxidase, partial [Chitinophagaceae bacterium]